MDTSPTAPAHPPIQIHILTDFVCANSYLGHRALQRALALYRKTVPGARRHDNEDDPITLTYHPYFLAYNPHPTESADKAALARRLLPGIVAGVRRGKKNGGGGDVGGGRRREAAEMGGEEEEEEAAGDEGEGEGEEKEEEEAEEIAAFTTRTTKRLDAAGRALGIRFRWGGRIGPGVRASWGAWWCVFAMQERRRRKDDDESRSWREMRDALVDLVFEAYHEQEQDISQGEVLAELLGRAGMSSKTGTKVNGGRVSGDGEGRKKGEDSNTAERRWVMAAEKAADEFLGLGSRVRGSHSSGHNAAAAGNKQGSRDGGELGVVVMGNEGENKDEEEDGRRETSSHMNDGGEEMEEDEEISRGFVDEVSRCQVQGMFSGVPDFVISGPGGEFRVEGAGDVEEFFGHLVAARG